MRHEALLLSKSIHVGFEAVEIQVAFEFAQDVQFVDQNHVRGGK